MKRWKRISHALEYAGVRVAIAVASLFPIGTARWFGARLGSLAFDGFGVRRDVAVDNVKQALGVDEAEARAIARRSYRNLGRTLMEFVALRRLTHADLRSMVRLEGLEHIEAARREGRGVVYLSAHQGNWELLGMTIAAHGIPVSYLVGEQTNRRVDAVMNDLRARQSIGIIPRAMALKNVLRRLRQNEMVAMLADQDARRDGIFVEFLGRPAATVRGPAMFAIRQGCPVVFGFMHRDGAGNLVGRCYPPVHAPKDLDEEAAVHDIMQRYHTTLGEAVRNHPDEYFWGHRRWKTQPPGS